MVSIEILFILVCFTGQHSATIFDIIPLELVCFKNSRYSISSCSFSCPVLLLSLSFLYLNVEVEND